MKHSGTPIKKLTRNGTIVVLCPFGHFLAEYPVEYDSPASWMWCECDGALSTKKIVSEKSGMERS